ncbi:MAG: hypothetical protein ACAI25_05645, partial [Planctomycetota bacterium]
FGEKIRQSGHYPEEGLAWLISACVEAKEIRPECGILELQDAYSPQTGRATFPTETARALATNTFPSAVLKEVRKALGTAKEEAPLPPPVTLPTPPPPNPHAKEPAQPYSPLKDWKVGMKVIHKKFGTGEVKKVLNHNKIIVAFGADEKQFAQNQSVETPSSPAVAAAEPGSVPGGSSSPPSSSAPLGGSPPS